MGKPSVKQRAIKSSVVDEEQDYFDNLIQIKRSAYKPGGTGLKVHMSLARTKICRGGLGCIREATRIQTAEGGKPAGEISKPENYLTWDGTQFQLSRGTAPFPKGKENLYRVVHERGEFVAAGHHLVLLPSGKYASVESLEKGSVLFGLSGDSIASLDQSLSTGGIFPSEWLSGAQHWKRRLAGWLDSCAALVRRCDQRLLLVEEGARVSASQPVDVLGFFRRFECSDRRLQGFLGLPEARRSHLCRLFDHLARLDFSGLGAEPALALGAGDSLATAFGHISWDSRLGLRSQPRSGFHLRASESRQRCTWPSDLAYADAAILAIERLPFAEWYWDLQVPGDNNYIAEGVVHHNSGKSRCAGEQVNNLALQYPNSTHVIARKDMTSLKETTQKEFLEKIVDSATIETFNVNENKLTYKNGSTVLFRECKDPDKFKSMELTSYFIDEADENPSPEIWEKIDERLRQKWETGKYTETGEPVYYYPPFCGLLVFNPVNDQHWLYGLANRQDIDVADFQFSTYENKHNLPPDYIPNLLKKLPPWDVDRLVHGNWGRVTQGVPVYHGFRRETHVRPLKMREDLPLMVGWDFGFNHPAVVWAQLDPVSGRLFVLREYLGTQQMLQDVKDRPGVASEYKKTTQSLIGATPWPIFHYGDPHGNDKKDVGVSSIEYLRIHHGIHVQSRREEIKTGMDELQHKISTDFPVHMKDPSQGEWPLLVVDPSCLKTITALEGGYARDPVTGLPVKDGLHDHLMDALRYLVVNTMNSALRKRYKQTSYKPKNHYAGY
jgi:hypothetical protein